MDDEPTMTLRSYLTIVGMVTTGCDIHTAMEAVASTAIEHPEWDLTVRDSFDKWQEQYPFPDDFPVGNRPPL